MTIRILIAILSVATFLHAQDPEPKKAIRLESVRIDVQECKLTWTITEGTADADGKFTATTWREFSIDLEKATMEELTLARNDAFREFPTPNRKTDEVRNFDPAEAKSVHQVTDMLVMYSAESAMWWDAGMGRKKPEGQIAKSKAPSGDRP